ncbi:MAG: hypothetical protein M3O34_09585 [Chloroflexota bacterium]|nr:hypothetical protein [Chloroflexota bacterium]
MRKRAGFVAFVALVFGLGQAFAQTGIPNGAFVRDSRGDVWLVVGGQRSAVPIYPATDEQIAAVPDGGQWLVPAWDGSGGLVLGTRPTWAGQSGPATTGTSPIMSDAPPSVTIQVDDETIDSGETISITVIASDDDGIEWIEWEGTIVDDDDDNENDNRRTGDAALDGRHRHECDDEQTQCASIWTVTPTKSGRFTLRARARDTVEQRSEWVTVPLRVR